MAKQFKALRAVDLYSGVGGWSLGLKMAGIEVVASYDIWRLANETNTRNNGHATVTGDLRKLRLADLPHDIDIVVGSPPCTQFSFANRGGGGDISDGLTDVALFLRVIDHLKPKAWAMENVPRMAGILDKELAPGGTLASFAHLELEHKTINMEDFGLPQRRKRCIAGNFDFARLASYSDRVTRRTLGDVINALSSTEIVDPIYGTRLSSERLYDHIAEDGLSDEELRINRANKVDHPVYNRMAFPDPLDRAVRTITATCTRVSRESIVVTDRERGGIRRRLTIRERASLQGFPVTFQFLADSYSKKIKMVGNAVPPLFAYYVANALMGREPQEIRDPKPPMDQEKPIRPASTPPARVGALYPVNRTFRFAVPNLRLSSGVRFELTNAPAERLPNWQVKFVFGTSKSIHSLSLDNVLFEHLRSYKRKLPIVAAELRILEKLLSSIDLGHLQDVWTHRIRSKAHPFEVLDALDKAGATITRALSDKPEVAQSMILSTIALQHEDKVIELKGVERLRRNAAVIASGLLVGTQANAVLARSGQVFQVSSVEQKRYGS